MRVARVLRNKKSIKALYNSNNKTTILKQNPAGLVNIKANSSYEFSNKSNNLLGSCFKSNIISTNYSSDNLKNNYLETKTNLNHSLISTVSNLNNNLLNETFTDFLIAFGEDDDGT
eukprot:TRINITY_DN3442_c0_g1_i1.p1 TRINITY_DN3442_c0_g1~~TRINITY_DN3442_c0_g1_i1.p1  ORF type:complete len:116 (-),score=23.56 TRINITY_DN3442_c0_g1_i1:117-464(-)